MNVVYRLVQSLVQYKSNANGTNWVSISGHQILIVSGRVLKQCYLHNNMDADCECLYYCYLWCDHCWLL